MPDINWQGKAIINGKATTLENWLRVAYKFLSDRDIAAIFRENGMHAGRETIRSRRRMLGLKKEQGYRQIEAPEGETFDTVSVEIMQQVAEFDPAVIVIEETEQPPAVEDQDLLKAIQNSPKTLRELSHAFDRSEETIRERIKALREQHYNIIEIEGRQILDTKSAPRARVDLPHTLADAVGMRIKMGWISDLHAGSSAQQITNMITCIRWLYAQDVRFILVAGDLFAGDKVYRGQVHDLFAIGATRQMRVLLDTLPVMSGLHYLVIGGNHDFSFIKGSGYNIVADFANQRDDVYYLGYDMADVPITDRVDVRLWHPSGGVPYSMSYRLQKGVEQMAFDELSTAIQTEENSRLRGVASGHLHVSMTMWQGPIFTAQVGCFEGQTNYLKRKSLFPKIGGYLVEWRLTDSGLIQECLPCFQAYTEIPDDYRNYPELLKTLIEIEDVQEHEPLFSWEPEEETAE